MEVTADMTIETPIGYMAKSHIITCKPCTEAIAALNGYVGVALFDVNVGSYSQRCHRCGIKLHVGKLGWPELFTANNVEVASLVVSNARIVELWTWASTRVREAILAKGIKEAK